MLPPLLSTRCLCHRQVARIRPAHTRGGPALNRRAGGETRSEIREAGKGERPFALAKRQAGCCAFMSAWRCIMTSYDPDTLVQDREITRSIYRRFDGKLALNCFVIAGGEIAVGDEVQLVQGRACAQSAAFTG